MNEPVAAVVPHRVSLPMVAVRSLSPVLIGLGFALLMHLVIGPWIVSSFDSGPFYVKILLDIGINIILAVSLNMVNGFTGQFSIGHAGFMAAGGYMAAAITYYCGASSRIWGADALDHGLVSFMGDPAAFEGAFIAAGDWLFLVACVVGGLVAAVLGVIVGLPSLRLRGDYLAIVTLGFGEIIRVLLELSQPQLMTLKEVQATPVIERFSHLGGSLGMSGMPFNTTLFWVYAFVAATVLAAFRIRQSSHGRAFLAIREEEIAAESMGVPTTRYKVSAFVMAAFFAGIAGGLFAHQLGVQLNPGELGFLKSFDILIMVVLGGQGSITGAVVAAILLTILPEWLRDPPSIWPAMIVVVLLVAIFRQKRGIKTIVVLVIVTVLWEVLRATLGDLSKYRMILYALSLIVMMIMRPQGLFGIHELWHLPKLLKRRKREVQA